MFKKLLLGSVIGFSFAYGVAVGHYNIFPFDQLKSIRTTLSPPPQSPFSSSDLYMSHQKLFAGLEKKYDVVFLGDSITNAGRWSEAFPSMTVANRGIGGDTSEGILSRLDTIMQIHPNIVYLMFGINDIGRGESVETIFRRYQKIVKKLVDNDVKVIIQSTLLSDRPHWNIQVNELNKKLISLSEGLTLTYIDLNKEIAPSGILTPEVSNDGVHLKAEVYLKWFDIIKNTNN
jgi:hypothetical protein